MIDLVHKDAPGDGPNRTAELVLDSIEIDWKTLLSLLVPEFLEAGKQGVDELIAGLGLDQFVSWDDVAPDVQRYADTRAAELIGMHRREDGIYVPSAVPGIAITDTTRDMLRTTVRDAIAEGSTAAELQTAIIDNYAFSPARALAIARTETAFARNHGQLIAARASGVCRRKRWELGEEACEECRALAALGWIDIALDFPGGIIAPPLHPNCVCSLGYEVSGRRGEQQK